MDTRAALVYFEEHLWSRVAHEGWPGGHNRYGYGYAYPDGKQIGVHVLACERAHGPRPEGLVVRHSCRDHPDCFYPPHLSWGTQRQNAVDDRRRDGTMPQGEVHSRAKLTATDVQAIRFFHEWGARPHQLARSYDVTKSAIQGVIRGVTWKHLLEGADHRHD